MDGTGDGHYVNWNKASTGRQISNDLTIKKKQTTETGVWKNQDQNQKPADPTGVTSRMVVTRGLEGKWRARDEERLTDSYQATDRWELLAIFTIKKC